MAIDSHGHAQTQRIMIWGSLSTVLLGLVALVVLWALPAGAADPDPLTCEGYPEKRVYLENQSWVSPQPAGEVPHPGDGQDGHIHVGTCYPLFQTLTGDTLSLDINFKLHNVPGDPQWLIVQAYGLNTDAIRVDKLGPWPFKDGCDVVDCQEWFHFDFPLDDVATSGWTQIGIWYAVQLDSGIKWYNINNWSVFVDNGAPSDPTPLEETDRIGGDTWIQNSNGSNYSETWITSEFFPWDSTTGEFVPVSGVWEPEVSFCCSYKPGTTGFATVDPAQHGQIPGTIVYDGPAQFDLPLSIDTTVLANGMHKLLLASCNPNVSGGLTQCGVLVVPFEVQNAPPATTTTTTPPTVIQLSPGEQLIVRCDTVLTGTIAEVATLTCNP